MKKLYFVFSLMAVCVLTAVAFSQSAHSKFKASETGVAGRYIVLLNDKSASDPAAPFVVNSLANDIASSYGGTVERTYSVAVKGFSTIMSEEQAVALSNDSRVKLVEPDRAITLSSQQTNAPWHLDRIDQRALPWDTTYNYSSSGAGVHVYILDTGIRVTHQEFGGRASVANDFVGDGQNGNDCNGHGTHVAGLVGGSTWGVAKQASLHIAVLGHRAALKSSCSGGLGNRQPRQSGSCQHQLDGRRLFYIARDGNIKFHRFRCRVYDRGGQRCGGCMWIHPGPYG
jgi:subtilisin family serine protease